VHWRRGGKYAEGDRREYQQVRVQLLAVILSWNLRIYRRFGAVKGNIKSGNIHKRRAGAGLSAATLKQEPTPRFGNSGCFVGGKCWSGTDTRIDLTATV